MPKIKKEYVTWEEFNRYITGGIGEGGDASYYTKTELDAFFEGEASGKKQVHWDRVTNTPSTYPPSAHTLASHSSKAHSELTGVTSDLHHPQAHTLASHSTKPHSALTGVTSDQHHAQAHTLASHSTKAHSELTGVTADLHHAQDHASRHESGGDDSIKLDDFATPDDNVNLNASISRHGLFRKLSNHAAECLNGIGNWLRLYDSTSIIIGILTRASANLRNSNDTERTTTAGTYTKVKEVQLGEATGVMRIYFTLESVGGETVYGRIRKNGVAIGTARSTTTVGTWNEDLGGFDSGDLIQIYAYAELEDTAKVRNMRFRYDRSIDILGEHTLTTPLIVDWKAGWEIEMTNQDPA